MCFAALHLTHSFPRKSTIYRSMTQTRAMDSACVYINNNNNTYSGPIHQSRPGTVRVPINGFPILDNPTKVISFMFRTLLVLKILKYPTPNGGHLGFVQNGCHRGSPSWLPREIGRLWSYLALVQNWCLWNDVNNHGVFED